MSKPHSIKTERTAIFYSLGNPVSSKTIWFVLHGYGMLAKYFIKKFEGIANENNCVIAPEGLSRFYTNGFYGRVGASWMTKEERETEISDYINYLNKLYKYVLEQNTQNEVKINVLGFSQGGATASRWVMNKTVKPDNFILWSSAFPDDMNFKSFENGFNTYVIYGNKDEFATHKRIKDQLDILNESNMPYQLIEFNGVHDIPNDVLKEQTKIRNW